MTSFKKKLDQWEYENTVVAQTCNRLVLDYRESQSEKEDDESVEQKYKRESRLERVLQGWLQSKMQNCRDWHNKEYQFKHQRSYGWNTKARILNKRRMENKEDHDFFLYQHNREVDDGT